MMPDGIAFVLTSSNERGGVPSAKKRFPVPSRSGYPASGGPIGRGPVAVGEIAVIGGVLDHAVQRDVFDDCELSHLSLCALGLSVSHVHSLVLDSAGIGKRSWIDARQRAHRTFSRSMMAWMRGSDRMGA